MKKFVKVTFSTVMILAMFLSTWVFAYDFDYALINPFDAQTITFNNGTFGRMTPQSNEPLNGVYPYEIVTDPSNETNKYIRFNNVAQGSQLFYYTPGNGYLEGKMHFSFDLNMQSRSSGGRFRVYFRNSPYSLLSYVDITAADTDNCYFQLVDESGYQALGNLKFPNNTWYTLHFQFNIAKGKYKAWIADRATGEKLGATEGSKTFERNVFMNSNNTAVNKNSFTFVEIMTNNAALSTFYIDNVSMLFEKTAVMIEPAITVSDTDVTANAAVRNDFNTPVDCPILILALYDSNNKLIGISQDNNGGQQIPVDKTEFVKTNLTCGLTKPTETFTARAFLWSALSGLKPFCNYGVYPK